jgi:hypothetical protein
MYVVIVFMFIIYGNLMKGKLQGSRQPFQGQGIASLDHLAGAPRAAVAGQNGPRGKPREMWNP